MISIVYLYYSKFSLYNYFSEAIYYSIYLLVILKMKKVVVMIFLKTYIDKKKIIICSTSENYLKFNCFRYLATKIIIIINLISYIKYLNQSLMDCNTLHSSWNQ